MIEFRNLSDDEPALVHSPLLKAVELTFGYMVEHGSIGLTPSTAFKRNFVHWAAKHFEWPGYSEEELFSVNKVLNEYDFMPVSDIHALLLGLKLGRHSKGEFKLTKAGQSLVGQRGRLFGIITPAFLFNLDHSFNSRFEDKLFGTWDIFLNVLNLEAEGGATGEHIRHTLYGPSDTEDIYDRDLSALYVNVLRPLCWAGLLYETRADRRYHTKEYVFSKTPLWRATLRLYTDPQIRIATRH